MGDENGVGVNTTICEERPRDFSVTTMTCQEESPPRLVPIYWFFRFLSGWLIPEGQGAC